MLSRSHAPTHVTNSLCLSLCLCLCLSLSPSLFLSPNPPHGPTPPNTHTLMSPFPLLPSPPHYLRFFILRKRCRRSPSFSPATFPSSSTSVSIIESTTCFDRTFDRSSDCVCVCARVRLFLCRHACLRVCVHTHARTHARTRARSHLIRRHVIKGQAPRLRFPVDIDVCWCRLLHDLGRHSPVQLVVMHKQVRQF